jgi:hypothetical protein
MLGVRARVTQQRRLADPRNAEQQRGALRSSSGVVDQLGYPLSFSVPPDGWSASPRPI